MSAILFDNGRSYVVPSIPVKQQEYRVIDSLGRTQEDRDFLKRFESIFYAAAFGDLGKCKKVVNTGFCDFNAYSIGRLVAPSGVFLDHISPLQIAKLNNNQSVVEYFKSQMTLRKDSEPMHKKEMLAADTASKRQAEINSSFNALQRRDSDSEDKGGIASSVRTMSLEGGKGTAEERVSYQNHMNFLKEKMPTFSIAEKSLYIMTVLTGSFTSDELEDALAELTYLNTDQKQLKFLKDRCTQPFNCKEGARKKSEMTALVDYLESNKLG